MDVESVFMKDAILKFSRLILPLYQRKYCWNEFHWNQLLGSLMMCETEHYMGRIFVAYIEQSEEVYVIDGQQRLTTIFILLSCLRKRLLSMLNSDQRLRNNEEVDNSLFMGRKEPLMKEKEKSIDLILLMNNDQRSESLRSLLQEIDALLFVGGKEPLMKEKVKPVDYYRFIPTPRDQPNFFKSLTDETMKKVETCLIAACKEYFEKELNGKYSSQVIPFIRAIMKLKVVLIILQERTEMLNVGGGKGDDKKKKYAYRSIQEKYNVGGGKGDGKKEKYVYRSIQEMYNEIFNINQNAAFLYNPNPGKLQKNYDMIRNMLLMKVNDRQEEFDRKYFSQLESIVPYELRDDFLSYFLDVKKVVDRYNRVNNLYFAYIKWQTRNPLITAEDVEKHLIDLIEKSKMFVKECN